MEFSLAELYMHVVKTGRINDSEILLINRSMIQAKRRKQRMKERRYKSQLQLSTDTKYNLDNTTFKVHYTKRKRTSNERLFKQKASHTDSGHDSEIVSPCTSPDTRRHVGNMTSQNNADGFNDISDSWVPRQGTLPRKSWEIRLRNTQHLRKCRSRESLLTPSAKLYATSNSVFDTGYWEQLVWMLRCIWQFMKCY